MSDNDLIRRNKEEKVQKILSVIKIILFLLVVVGIPLMIYFRNPEVIHLFTDREALNKLLSEHENKGMLIYLGIQIVQVIISVLPGQLTQMAAGYVFGGIKAYLISIIGAFIGTIIAFNLSKYLGKDIITLIFKEKNINKFVNMMDSSKAFVAIIVIYLIPGLPKDVFTYAAGLTHYKALKFTIISVIARSPAMIGSLAFGRMLREENYIGMVILCVVIGALLVIAFFKRKDIYTRLESLNKGKKGSNESN